MIDLPWNERYIPHRPFPKQLQFLLTTHRFMEVGYGGAGGGGKSDAIAMAALQYVHIPKYSAIIFRRTMEDARRAGSLLDRLSEWLTPTDAKPERGNRWRFPSGATVEFAYMKNVNDHHNYQGAEFQFIAFDEITHFLERQYRYMFSRLRRTKCPYHGGRVVDGQPDPLEDDPTCALCQEYAPLAAVPLRCVAAGNPGGVGHAWVKHHWKIRRTKAKQPDGRAIYAGTDSQRPFIPAFIRDNPALDETEYVRSLMNLDPTTREQILAGDWGVTTDGRFKREWQKRYSTYGSLPSSSENQSGTPAVPTYFFEGPNRTGKLWKREQLHYFVIIDSACNSKEQATPKDSQTVIVLYALTPTNKLFIVHGRSMHAESPEIITEAKAFYKTFHPAFIGMELTTQSKHLYQMMRVMGLPMRAFTTGGTDKLGRSVDAQNRMKEGGIYFPTEPSSWQQEMETEVFTWTGDKEEPDDWIDALAYGSIYVSQKAASSPTDILDTVSQHAPAVPFSIQT